jgi:hypothetical protein
VDGIYGEAEGKMDIILTYFSAGLGLFLLGFLTGYLWRMIDAAEGFGSKEEALRAAKDCVGEVYWS